MYSLSHSPDHVIFARGVVCRIVTKVPYLVHLLSISIQLFLARWFEKIPSNIICTLITTSCTSLSLLLILLYLLKPLPPLSMTFSPGWTWTNCFSIHLKLNFFWLAQNNSVSNFLIWQTYLSAMISSQSVPLLAILASSLILACFSLIKSTLYPNLVIFISETSVEFIIVFLSPQPLLMRIHLSSENLTTAIYFTLASHKQISTNFKAFKIHWHVSFQTLQKINTSHQYLNNYTGFLSNKNRLQNLSSHIQNTYKSKTYIYLQ